MVKVPRVQSGRRVSRSALTVSLLVPLMATLLAEPASASGTLVVFPINVGIPGVNEAFGASAGPLCTITPPVGQMVIPSASEGGATVGGITVPPENIANSSVVSDVANCTGAGHISGYLCVQINAAKIGNAFPGESIMKPCANMIISDFQAAPAALFSSPTNLPTAQTPGGYTGVIVLIGELFVFNDGNALAGPCVDGAFACDTSSFVVE